VSKDLRGSVTLAADGGPGSGPHKGGGAGNLNSKKDYQAQSLVHAGRAVATAKKAVEESKARIAASGPYKNQTDINDRNMAMHALNLSKTAQATGKPSDHMKAERAHVAASENSDKNGEHHGAAAASHRLAAWHARGGTY
jgi:hypothetical protein